MPKLNIYNRFYYLLLIFVISTNLVPAMVLVEKPAILIINSYNPDTRRMASNINQFITTYREKGGNFPIDVLNLNCQSFSEMNEWKQNLEDLFDQYLLSHPQPVCLVFLGQEAFSSYLSSLYNSIKKETPVLGSMISSNTLLLPDTVLNTSSWNPESKNVFSIVEEKGLFVGGYIYEYNIDKNVELARRLYPDLKHIALLTDNSFGGVNMESYVKNEFKKHKDLDLIFIDGRLNDIYSITAKMSKLPENTVLFLATWRVDKSENFYITNATYTFMAANPSIPAFTLTSSGLGHWPIGGYFPVFKDSGSDLANLALQLENNFLKAEDLKLEKVPNHYVFDVKELEGKKIKKSLLPEKYSLVNTPESLLVKYRIQIMVIIIIVLFLFIITLTWAHYRSSLLKRKLLKSQKELRQAKEKAEQSDKLKSAFLANMSHEIRTPLNSIIGFSSLLVDAETEEERKEYVKIIENSNELLLQLINDILDLSKIEARTLEFVAKDVDLNALFEEIERSAKLRSKLGVEISFVERVEICKLLIDKNRLSQVVHNLINNAIKFTEKGSIHFGYRNINSGLYVYIKDTGRGIPSDKVDSIFNRFVKLNDFVQGTGLGLSICEMIVKRFGGSIGVDSKEGVGSNFWFIIPKNFILDIKK